MYLIHCPEGTVFASEAFVDTWNEMEILVVQILGIQLSTYSFTHGFLLFCRTISWSKALDYQTSMHSKSNIWWSLLVYHLLLIRLNVIHTFTQRELREFCSQKRILVNALNIFGTPALLEDPLVCLLFVFGVLVMYIDELLFQIVEMAKKYKRTTRQILLRYQIDKGHIAVPEVQNKSDLMSNLDVFKFELNKSDISAMDKLDRNKQYIWSNLSSLCDIFCYWCCYTVLCTEYK